MKSMANLLSWIVCLVAGMVTLGSGCTKSSPPSEGPGGKSGAELFRDHCASCHPDGGNLFYPQKSLHRGVLAANGITTPEAIVDRMRNPGPRMKRFDRGELDDRDAGRIAAYILETFR